MANSSYSTPGRVRVQKPFRFVFLDGSKWCENITCLMSVSTSWQATAPFLQFGAVGALTLLSPFVFHRFHLAKTRMCQTRNKCTGEL